MNLNELIKKYEEKIKYNNRIQQKLIDECQVYAFDLANDNEVCEEILSDLEKLKKSIKDLDITSINAPNIVITQMMKNEIIGE